MHARFFPNVRRRSAGRFCFLLATLTASLLALTTIRAADVSTTDQAFRPGRSWSDQSGNPVNAHGVGVLHHEGVFYWYGEFKDGLTYVTAANKSWGGTRVLAGGVSCYSSTNLYDWKNEGLVLRPAPDQPASDLHPEKVIERPKVIY